MGKLPGIQLARAIAALSVCYFHSWTVLDRFPKGTSYPMPLLSDMGWIGVDLFFAISGFVIAMQCSKPSFNVGNFLAKRALRLYPLWWLCLGLFAFMALSWRGLQPTETIWNFVYSATLLPSKDFPFYDIGWSLQHEMMFYLAAALLMPIFGFYSLIIFLAAGALAANLLPVPLQGLAFYYPEFAAGILAFLLLHRLRRIPAAFFLTSGAFSLYFFAEVWGGRIYFPIPLFLLTVGFAAMKRAPFVTIGDASYSLYLLHPIVFAITKAATIPVLAAHWIQEPIRWASIAIAIGMSLLCYRFFEQPTNRLSRLNNAKKLVEDDSGLDVVVSSPTTGIDVVNDDAGCR